MQTSKAARDAERRRGHIGHISISDPAHHVTDAIAYMYGDNDWQDNGGMGRPTTVTTPLGQATTISPSYPDMPINGLRTTSPPNMSASTYTTPPKEPNSERHRRTSSIGSLHGSSSPPQLTRSTSSDTAIQRFPLNDIDYESSPAAVAQELNNLHAIRRMSMNVDNADPDLPYFGTSLPSPPGSPSPPASDNDAARLFWVPASLHPELAPKEFKTFVEERVHLIRRSSSKEDKLSPRSTDRKVAGNNLQRKKSTLSKTINDALGYEDGADVLERRRSKDSGHHQRKLSETTLHELETLVSDDSQATQGLTDDASAEMGEDGLPIVPAFGAAPLKRSIRTNYRRGSLRKGERVTPPKRAVGRLNDGDSPHASPIEPGPGWEEGGLYALDRAQTEPIMPTIVVTESPDSHANRSDTAASGQSMAFIASLQHSDMDGVSQDDPKPAPSYPVFHSRIASRGRTTAILPGYNGPTELQHSPTTQQQIQQTLGQAQPLPERKSSHEFRRANTMQTVPIERAPMPAQLGRTQVYPQQQTLDEMVSRPSLIPGTNTRTDALTFTPTFPEDKREKKLRERERKETVEPAKKSGWSWLLGSDDKEKVKDKREKEDKDSKKTKTKITKVLEKLPDNSKAELSRKPPPPPEDIRGRQSLVLDRESIKLDDDRKKDSSKRGHGGDGKKEKESGLFSSLFGGNKKKPEREAPAKKPVIRRTLSLEIPNAPLRADIDYNWTRFSILEERAIYRMAHIKLANPRRSLSSQVLLSNFMYSYLAKVQQMHPQIQIPQYITQSMPQQQQQQPQQQHHQQGGRQLQPSLLEAPQDDEFAQWQRYQARHSQPSYDLNGSQYDGPSSDTTHSYGSSYIDDYDDGSGHQHHRQQQNHQQPQDQNAPWSAYQQYNGAKDYTNYESRQWEERGEYQQQSQFEDSRPSDGSVW